MQTLAQIKEILASRGLAPKKSLGQNFLIDHNLIRKLVDRAGVAEGDTVLEVGPGTGTLTEELLARGCRVVACELDDNLSAILRERADSIPGGARLTVVHGDCLGPDRRVAPAVVDALGNTPFRLVANLPYGAATPLMMSLLLDHPRCDRIAVTVQKEVADRVAAEPGTRDRGGLSVVSQALATVSRIATLPRECFWPRPDVTSAMILLERRAEPLTADPRALSEFCRALFARRRKQIGTILGRALPWPPGITAELRPEQLTVEQIETLRGIVAASTSTRPAESPDALHP